MAVGCHWRSRLFQRVALYPTRMVSYAVDIAYNNVLCHGSLSMFFTTILTQNHTLSCASYCMVSIVVMQGHNYCRGKGSNCLLAFLPWLHIELPTLVSTSSNKSSESNVTSRLAHMQGAEYSILLQTVKKQSCTSWFNDRFSTKHSFCNAFIWHLQSISHSHSWSLALEAMPTMKYMNHVFSLVSICMWLSENILHGT